MVNGWKQGKVDDSLLCVKKITCIHKNIWCIKSQNIILYNDQYDDKLLLCDYNVEKTPFIK